MMLDTFTAVLEWSGVAVFAVTGALVASRKQMDLGGFILLGTVTGIGGGTVRDLLLGVLPVFWIKDPAYLLTCVAVSCVAFFTAHIPQSRYRALLWFDAVGLALFAVAGAETALAAGAGPVGAVTLGVITATFGGIIRDVLGAEMPVILSEEIYASAALISALVFVAAIGLGLSRDISLVCGILAGFVLRGVALHRGWSLPRYRPRPGRRPEDIAH